MSTNLKPNDVVRHRSRAQQLWGTVIRVAGRMVEVRFEWGHTCWVRADKLIHVPC